MPDPKSDEFLRPPPQRSDSYDVVYLTEMLPNEDPPRLINYSTSVHYSNINLPDSNDSSTLSLIEPRSRSTNVVKPASVPRGRRSTYTLPVVMPSASEYSLAHSIDSEEDDSQPKASGAERPINEVRSDEAVHNVFSRILVPDDFPAPTAPTTPEPDPIVPLETKDDTRSHLNVLGPVTATTDFISTSLPAAVAGATREPEASPGDLAPSYSSVSLYPIYGKKPEWFPFKYMPSLLGDSDTSTPPARTACPEAKPPKVTPGKSCVDTILPANVKQDEATRLEAVPAFPDNLREFIGKGFPPVSPLESKKSNLKNNEVLVPGGKVEEGRSPLSDLNVGSLRGNLGDLTPLQIPNGIRLTDPSSPTLRNFVVQHLELDLSAIRNESFDSITPNSPKPPNFTRYISDVHRPRVKIDGKEQMDFIDYFAKKEGDVCIDDLKSSFVSYYERTKDAIRAKEAKYSDAKEKCEAARRQISELYKIVRVNEERELQDFDFPAALEKDASVFEIDYIPNVVLVAKLHNYGVQMILHYVKLLLRKQPISPTEIYNFATEMMADMVILCYGIFTKISEFLVQIITEPSADQLQTFTLNHLLQCFRNLVDCICDEIGAIGQSCSQLLIRINNSEHDKVKDVLSNILKQVNYANVAISRATESLAPVIHYYYVKRLLV